MLLGLGWRGRVGDLAVPRCDSVIDFDQVERHGRYVAAFMDNHPPRGFRPVAHGSETLAMHGRAGMSRLYDKGPEVGDPELQRSRFEWERHRGRMKALGIKAWSEFEPDRLGIEAEALFDALGYGREIAPLSSWAESVLRAVPVGPDGQPLGSYGPTVRYAALAWAMVQRVGGSPIQPSKNTLTKYRRLFREAGVEVEDFCLVEPEDHGDVVWLDTESRCELRRVAG
jgi:hypothetical protein